MDFRIELVQRLLRIINQPLFQNNDIQGRFDDRSLPEDVIASLRQSQLLSATESAHFLQPLLTELALCDELEKQERTNDVRTQQKAARERCWEVMKSFKDWEACKRNPNKPVPESIKGLFEKQTESQGTSDQLRELSDESDVDTEEGGVSLI